MTQPLQTETGSVLPFLTRDLPAIGGEIKRRAEDFLVEEIPRYDPAGEGEHVYLFVEKERITTQQAVQIIAKHFGVKHKDVGYAGLKDKRAITRQTISVHVPGKKPEDFRELRDDRIKILWTDLHRNKLRLGHLKGNRFSVRIRNVDLPSLMIAHKAIERLGREGVPNYFGEQRFGTAGTNHLLGAAVIRGEWDEAVRVLLAPNDRHPVEQARARELFASGDYSGALQAMPRNADAECSALLALSRGAPPSEAIRSVSRSIKRIWISAFQSHVFNTTLAHRLMDNSWNTVREGDVAYKHDSGACFAVDPEAAGDPESAARAERLEISPTGPMWGHKMMRAEGAVDAAELHALESTGVTIADLAKFHDMSKGELSGERRLMRVPVIDPEIEGGADEHGTYIRLAFELPPGSYATSVVREISKPGVPTGETPG